MDDAQVRLQEASRLFGNKNYVECESTLRSIASKDLKVQHNIAVAHYLAKGGDVRDVIAELKKKDDSATGSDVTLAYEGHEIAHYNSAVLQAYNGRCEEAAATLRELLQLHECIAPAVLGRCVCLFQMVTNASAIAPAGRPSGPQNAKKATQARSKSDEELVGQVLSHYMDEFKKDPALFRILQASLAADGSALHETAKAGTTTLDKAVYFNDLGVLAMGEGKHNTAALYFVRANRLAAEPTASVDTFTKHSILFNFSICSLHRHDYATALNALQTVQDTMQSSPSYWVRVAQAALGASQTNRATDVMNAYDAAQQERAATLSKGQVNPGFAVLQLQEVQAATITAVTSPHSGNNASESRRALLVVARRAALHTIQLLGGANLQEAADACYADGRVQEYRFLQYAYLYASAGALLLQDFASAAKYAAELIAVHRSRALLADVHASALLHATEAYCRLNKPSLALKALAAASLGELLTSDRSDGQQRSRAEALFVNLVLVHLSNGNYKQAQLLMSSIIPKLAANPSSVAGRTAVLLQLYLDLALGNKEKVLEQLAKSTVVPAVA